MGIGEINIYNTEEYLKQSIQELSEVQEKFVQYLSLVDLKIESSADSGF